MSKYILIIENSIKAPGGTIEKAFREQGAIVESINILENGFSGLSISGYGGLVVLGGPMSGYDDETYPQLLNIIDIILQFYDQSKPILGVCLGAQLLARALGEPYRSNGGWEVGFTPVSVTEAGLHDPLLEGIETEHCLYEFHQDSFYLPEDSTLIMTGENCQNQAFRVGENSYGLQFHSEVDEQTIDNWLSAVKSEPELFNDVSVISEQMVVDIETHMPKQKIFARQLAKRWLNLVQQREQQKMLL